MLHHKHHNIPPLKGKYKGQKLKKNYNRNSPHKKKKMESKLTRINSPQEQPLFPLWTYKTLKWILLPTKKFKCQHCHKTRHFTNCCFKKQKDNNNKGNYEKRDICGISSTRDDDDNGYASVDSNEGGTGQILHIRLDSLQYRYLYFSSIETLSRIKGNF